MIVSLIPEMGRQKYESTALAEGSWEALADAGQNHSGWYVESRVDDQDSPAGSTWGTKFLRKEAHSSTQKDDGGQQVIAACCGTSCEHNHRHACTLQKQAFHLSRPPGGGCSLVSKLEEVRNHAAAGIENAAVCS
jgi:hypothetical protein